MAATAAFAFAHFVVGHSLPLLALTVTLSSLGFVRDARPRRVLETALGLTLGIAVAEVLGTIAGTGVWQIAVVLFVALAVARLVGAPGPVAVAAATVSAFSLLLPVPSGGPFSRSIDGLIGGAVALVATALLPRDPVRAAMRDADAVFAAVRASVDDLVRALVRGDSVSSGAALERLRASQPLIDDWTVALDSATSVARLSPLLRGRRGELAELRRIRDGMDLAIRSLRLVARRVDIEAKAGTRDGALAEMLGAIGASVELIAEGMRRPRDLAAARADLFLVAERLDPAALVPDGAVGGTMVVMLVRPLVMDLLQATGVQGDRARAALPPL